MNVIVKTYTNRYIVRPDTTWERDNEDLYLPEFADQVSYVPVLFARISKPGRSVGEKFADRYYDGIGYGVLIYPENMIDGSAEGFACASCLDHTSFLPFPIYNKSTLGQDGSIFEMSIDGERVFEYDKACAGMICKAIAEATRYIYIRTGDLIAIELEGRKMIDSASESINISGTYCDNKILDFRIIR